MCSRCGVRRRLWRGKHSLQTNFDFFASPCGHITRNHGQSSVRNEIIVLVFPPSKENNGPSVASTNIKWLSACSAMTCAQDAKTSSLAVAKAVTLLATVRLQSVTICWIVPGLLTSNPLECCSWRHLCKLQFIFNVFMKFAEWSTHYYLFFPTIYTGLLRFPPFLVWNTA